MVLEKILESPLDCKEIQPVYPKGNQSWIFIGRTDTEAETPILWLPDVKNWLLGKDLDAGKDWRQEEKGMTEDELVGWHHWLDGHEFEQASGVGDGQGSLACCSSWGHKESDMSEWLNWTVHLRGTYKPWEHVQAGTRDYLTLNWPHTAHKGSRETPRYIFTIITFQFFKTFSSLLLLYFYLHILLLPFKKNPIF